MTGSSDAIRVSRSSILERDTEEVPAQSVFSCPHEPIRMHHDCCASLDDGLYGGVDRIVIEIAPHDVSSCPKANQAEVLHRALELAFCFPLVLQGQYAEANESSGVIAVDFGKFTVYVTAECGSINRPQVIPEQECGDHYGFNVDAALVTALIKAAGPIVLCFTRRKRHTTEAALSCFSPIRVAVEAPIVPRTAGTECIRHPTRPVVAMEIDSARLDVHFGSPAAALQTERSAG